LNYRAYFDIPKETKFKNIKGSSPYLLENLIKELKDAIDIKISFFLYNNPFFHSELEQLSSKGCLVKIYSIPLNGYTKQSVEIYNPIKDRSFYSSKYQYAEKIYKRIEKKLFPNIELKVFPHTYVWHKQFFSRGKEAYSLHNKSLIAKMKNGDTKCISLSSNLAFADPPHSDNFLVVENEKFSTNMFEKYFDLLSKSSLSLSDYEKFSSSKYDFEYQIQPSDLNHTQFDGCYYTAPFITYNGQGSNHFVQDKIINFIKSAKEKIYICSQHFMDIDPFDKMAKSIVHSLGELSSNNQSVDIKILKQTRSTNQAQGKRTHLAEEYLKIIKNVEQRYLSPTIHDKFIIVDNKIIITTANITPTQFAWDFPHKMKYQLDEQVHIIENCFSEVNSFHFIKDAELTESYKIHFKNLWSISNRID